MKKYLRLIRPKHYIKNIIIFFPLVFSGKLTDISLSLKTAAGFIIFSLVASSLYCINDIHDKEKDALHPVKRNRPIASGEISVKSALVLSAFLFITGITLNIICFDILSSLWLTSYFIVSILYSVKLKHIPIADVLSLSFGYPARLFYASTLCGIAVSEWMFLTLISGALFLVFGKRAAEHKEYSELETRNVLSKYTYGFLEKNMYVFYVLTVVFYTLWCLEHINESKLILCSVPVVLIIGILYTYNVEKGEGDPITVLFKDKMILVFILILVIIFFAFLYFL